MIDVIQGASVILSLELKDNDGNVIDPATTENVILELYPETTHEVIAKYSVDTIQGYGNAAIDGNNILVYVDSPDTQALPIGIIAGRVTVTFVNANFPSGYETLISRGTFLNVLP